MIDKILSSNIKNNPTSSLQKKNQSHVNFEYPKDTVSFSGAETVVSEDEKRKKRNKILKISAAVIAAAGVVAVAIFSKGRSLEPANFAEYIKFEKATTMQEAQEYAQKHFGIKLELGDDLDIANWALEGLTNINNKFKGKAQMPKKLIFDDVYFTKPEHKNAVAYCTGGKDPYIAFNKKAFDNAISTLEQWIEQGDKAAQKLEKEDKGTIKELVLSIINSAKKNPTTGNYDVNTTPLVSKDLQAEIFKNIINFRENRSTFTKFDAMHTNMLIDDLISTASRIEETPMSVLEDIFKNEKCKEFIINDNTFKSLAEYRKMKPTEQTQACIDIMTKLSDNGIEFYPKTTCRGNSEFDILYHEMGHLLHNKNTSIWDSFWGKLSKKSINNFKNDAAAQKIAGEISWYAQTSPKEYVAECFNAIISGRTLTDEQMKLYRLYKGPEIDKFVQSKVAA